MAELDFIERTVTIREQGSIEFEQAELGADIVLVDVKCTALAGTIYVNKRTLPDYGYYGAVTLFGGSTVKKRIPLDFVYQRVIDNETDYRRIMCYLSRLELAIREVLSKVSDTANIPTVGIGELPREFDYRGLPYTKLKIKSLIAAQWDVTIRSYKRFEPFNCQSQNKSDDPTKGEDEFPEPIPIPDPDNYPPILPEPDLPYPGADPEDFPEGSPSGNYPRPVYFGVRIEASSAVGQPNCTMDTPFSKNFLWEDAGPPPYTVDAGFNAGPCNNAGEGFRVVAGDGTKSPDQAPFTVFGGEVIVFSFDPIGGE